MAKKKAPMPATIERKRTPNRSGRPVRLDMSEADHKRMERLATEWGLNKASLARMIILKWLKEQEGRSK
ncbi:MAG TPA: hypothetical protein VJY33_20855 [Isosphaeraceae bacterium]|nr:hypothetical protein [Isosphaeraceae bacterium]